MPWNFVLILTTDCMREDGRGVCWRALQACFMLRHMYFSTSRENSVMAYGVYHPYFARKLYGNRSEPACMKANDMLLENRRLCPAVASTEIDHMEWCLVFWREHRRHRYRFCEPIDACYGQQLGPSWPDFRSSQCQTHSMRHSHHLTNENHEALLISFALSGPNDELPDSNLCSIFSRLPSVFSPDISS